MVAQKGCGGANPKWDALPSPPPLGMGFKAPSKLETDALQRVFGWMDQNGDGVVDTADINDVLKKLKYEQRDTRHSMQREVELMVWEVNDNLDGKVTWEEFLRIYKKCNADKTGFQPRRLYHLATFLLYDKDFVGRITVESTIDVLYMIHGNQGLDDQVKLIFGIDGTSKVAMGSDGKELSIDYNDYLERQQGKLVELRMSKEYKCLEGAKKIMDRFSGKELSARIKFERQKERERLGYF